MNPQKFREVCLWWVDKNWFIEKSHLCNLLFYCQGYYLAFFGEPLFEYDFYAVESGIAFQGEANEIINDILLQRDLAQFWLNTAYYFAGYLDYFR